MAVVPFERTLVASLDAIQLQLAICVLAADDLLEGRALPSRRIVGRAGRRLESWHWHPDIGEILPRIRMAAVEVDVLLLAAQMIEPGKRPTGPLREQVCQVRSALDALRREVAQAKFRARGKAILQDACPASSRARAFVGPNSTSGEAD
ncbi:hypothetical protein FQY83_02950 [Luteimonas marina]|uniref:Uncharacterized protein n=1 Tax=Luteimonas marina TaxID=488485 RepID=A0A5C5UD06_9GAMM|nr:hypothetical protein [Luteimonas marina]TWT23603.1 hypothetical protein FQY83_02950 [Luteimonas marina]